jgi:hypothetical protein
MHFTTSVPAFDIADDSNTGTASGAFKVTHGACGLRLIEPFMGIMENQPNYPTLAGGADLLPYDLEAGVGRMFCGRANLPSTAAVRDNIQQTGDDSQIDQIAQNNRPFMSADTRSSAAWKVVRGTTQGEQCINKCKEQGGTATCTNTQEGQGPVDAGGDGCAWYEQ